MKFAGFAIASFAVGISAALIVADDKPAPGKANPDEPAKKPITLRRGKADLPADKAADKKKDEKAPEVDGRNIPAPEPAKKRSDLDAKLLDELGQNLENAQEEEADPLMRAQRRMRESEELLAKSEPGEEVKTVDIQQKIVKDLEDLLKSPPQDPSKQSKSKSKKNAKKKMTMVQRPDMQRQQPGEKGDGKDKKANEAAKGAGGRRNEAEGRGRVTENKDIWGHLSATERQEMSQHAKENFLTKYREMLERYYTTIATKSKSTKE